MGQWMERDTERQTGGFERESSHTKVPSLKRKTSCGHRSDAFIKNTHVPHFLFCFEVILQADGEEGREGVSDFSLRSDNIPSGWSGSHSE